ncbi:hypothetical protein ACE6H2_019887 [Prunus campanulata]
MTIIIIFFLCCGIRGHVFNFKVKFTAVWKEDQLKIVTTITAIYLSDLKGLFMWSMI